MSESPGFSPIRSNLPYIDQAAGLAAGRRLLRAAPYGRRPRSATTREPWSRATLIDLLLQKAQSRPGRLEVSVPTLSTEALLDPEHILHGIDGLDFTMIKLKLMDADEGQGWSASFCDRVETEYRRYLALNRRYADRAIVPSKTVDNFWHAHILDTQAYAPDCEAVFGEFLHHYPYFGMRGEEDAQALGDAYDDTLNLYELHFGPPPEDLWARSGASRCPNCGRRCR